MFGVRAIDDVDKVRQARQSGMMTAERCPIRPEVKAFVAVAEAIKEMCLFERKRTIDPAVAFECFGRRKIG